MSSIDDLLAIVTTHTATDPVARISVSPSTWSVLRAFAGEHWIVYTGFEQDRLVSTPAQQAPGLGIGISIDPEQLEDFRLWDHEGREVHYRWGLYYHVAWGDC